MKTKLIQTKDYLLLIDEEAEIKKNGYAYQINYERTNIQVIKIESDSQERIANDKNGTFTKCKIIAYYPLNSEAKELDLPLLPSFEDTKPNSGYEEGMFGYTDTEVRVAQNAFQEGYKAAQSKVQYSLEDMETLMEEALNWFGGGRDKDISDSKEFFEKYIQSLSTQQLPKEFKPIMVCGRCLKPDDNDEGCWSAKECSRNTDFQDTFKTIANSEGKQEIQGRYVY